MVLLGVAVGLPLALDSLVSAKSLLFGGARRGPPISALGLALNRADRLGPRHCRRGVQTRVDPLVALRYE